MRCNPTAAGISNGDEVHGFPEVCCTQADAAEEHGDILKLRRNHMEVPAQTVLHRRDDLIQETGNVICERTVYNDDIRVERMQNSVQADRRIVDKIMQRSLRGGILLAVCVEKFVEGCRRTAMSFGIFLQNRRFGNILFQTALVAAGTGAPVRKQNRMAEFSCVAVLTFVKLSVDNDSHTHTFMNIEKNHISVSLSDGRLTDHRKIRLVFHDDRNVKGFLQKVAQIGIFQIIVWREEYRIVTDDAVNTMLIPRIRKEFPAENGWFSAGERSDDPPAADPSGKGTRVPRSCSRGGRWS